MSTICCRGAAAVLPSRFDLIAKSDPSKTMRAMVYQKHGPSSVMHYRSDHPMPMRAPGQSLVRISATAVNPVDCKMRSHRIPQLIFPLPKIPGTDISGEVIATDHDSGFQVGDRVFGMMPLLGTPWGSNAEYASISHRFLAKTPHCIDDVGAASLPLVSLTVLQGLSSALKHCDNSTEGKRILIQAGSGGVGTFALQYCARVLGMQVATTSSARNESLLRSLGAEVVIDYHNQNFDEVIRDYDFVFDPLGHRYANRTLHSGVLKRGGSYIHVAGSDWSSISNRRFIPEASPNKLIPLLAKQAWRNGRRRIGMGDHYYHLIFVHPSGKMLGEVANQVDAGKIIPVIDRTFALGDAIAAHDYVQEGHARGKVVLTLDQDSHVG